jgi:hypothetical protein
LADLRIVMTGGLGLLERRGDDRDDVADLVFDAMRGRLLLRLHRPENSELARARTDDIGSAYLGGITPRRGP